MPDGIEPPRHPFTKEAALRMAAWLVAMAEDKEGEFEAVFDAVMATWPHNG